MALRFGAGSGCPLRRRRCCTACPPPAARASVAVTPTGRPRSAVTRLSVTPQRIIRVTMASPVANPFRFGALARDDAFTDRKGEIAELVADARNGQDVVIFAPRRFGKTSLVDRVHQRLVRDKVLVGQVNLMMAPTKEKLAERLAAVVYEDI